MSLGKRTPEKTTRRNKGLASKGRYGDTMLAHVTPKEAKMLERRGGSGTRNPRTGLKEFFSAGDVGNNAGRGGSSSGGTSGSAGSSSSGGGSDRGDHGFGGVGGVAAATGHGRSGSGTSSSSGDTAAGDSGGGYNPSVAPGGSNTQGRAGPTGTPDHSDAVSPGGSNTQGRAGPEDKSTPVSPGGYNTGGRHDPVSGEVTGPADTSAMEGHPARDTTVGTPGIKGQTQVAEVAEDTVNSAQSTVEDIAQTFGLTEEEKQGVMGNITDFSKQSPKSLQERGFIDKSYDNAAKGYSETSFGAVDRAAAELDAAMQNQSTTSTALDAAAKALGFPVGPSTMRSAAKFAGENITGAIESVTGTEAGSVSEGFAEGSDQTGGSQEVGSRSIKQAYNLGSKNKESGSTKESPDTNAKNPFQYKEPEGIFDKSYFGNTDKLAYEQMQYDYDNLFA